MAATYEGKAKIVSVDAKELAEYQQRGLTADEIADGMNIVLEVQPEDAAFGKAYIEMEISARECTGTMAGKKQDAVTYEKLAQCGLMSKPDLDHLEEVFPTFDDAGNQLTPGAIGKTVSIFQKEESYIAKNGPNKGKQVTKIRTALSTNNRLGQSEISKRIQRMRMGKGGTTAQKPNPFDF